MHASFDCSVLQWGVMNCKFMDCSFLIVMFYLLSINHFSFPWYSCQFEFQSALHPFVGLQSLLFFLDSRAVRYIYALDPNLSLVFSQILVSLFCFSDYANNHSFSFWKFSLSFSEAASPHFHFISFISTWPCTICFCCQQQFGSISRQYGHKIWTPASLSIMGLAGGYIWVKHPCT